MVLAEDKCECGSCLPRIFYLGRLNDCFRLEKGFVFPENVEDILFKYGNIGEYRVEKHNDIYLIKTEGNERTQNAEMINELCDLFDTAVDVEVVNPGSLNYDGHAKRFSDESK